MWATVEPLSGTWVPSPKAHTAAAQSPVATLAKGTGTGAAPCPTSNMRLGSGIAPRGKMLAAGVKVGLAVDGSASNDGSHMLAEARQAMLLQRVKKGAGALSARQALEMATRGGAAVLGRDDLGVLAPGKAADFIAFALRGLGYAGAAVHDPLGALLFCQPRGVDLSVINGQAVVEDGHVVGFDMERIITCQNELARELAAQAQS